MVLRLFRKIRTAVRTVNPAAVQNLAEQPLVIGLLADHEAAHDQMMRFLLPPGTPEPKARRAADHILRIQRSADFDRCDIGLAESHLESVPHFFPFDAHDPGPVLNVILDRYEELWLPLARNFVLFRRPVADRLIFKVARENAAFAVASALPNIAPLLFQLPWAAGEFASDTVVLTMNQVRLAFLLAAANEAPVGLVEQKGQIAAIVSSAFGWRAIARELVSKMPLGAGLIPKGAIAFAGTYVMGLGLQRYLCDGGILTARERRAHYSHAYERGRDVVVPFVKAAGGNRP